MKLPNGDRAIIDEEKILNYILDPLHREGQHHAKLFRQLLGIERDDWMLLMAALREAARAMLKLLPENPHLSARNTRSDFP